MSEKSLDCSPSPKGASTLSASFSLVMTSVGLGILSMPRATATAGWVGGGVMLLLGCLFVYYTTILLWKALYLDPKNPDRPIPTLEAMGRICFGTPGAIVNGLTLHTLLVGVCAIMLVLLGQCSFNVTGVLSMREWLVIWAAICVPFAWMRNMKEVGMVAGIGVASVAAAVIAIVVACSAKYIDQVDSGAALEYHLIASEPATLFGSFCTFLLSFTVSVTVPTIVNDMEKPKEFPKAAAGAFGFIFGVYVAVSVVGYLAFGAELLEADSIVSAISPSGEPLSVYAWIINLVVIVLVAVHFLVLFMPTAQALDSLLDLENETRWASPRVAEGARMLARTGLVALCALIGILVPSVDKLVGLLGAVSIILIALIFPVVYYWRLLHLNGKKETKPVFAFQVFLVAFAVCAMVFGTYQAVLAFF